MSGLVLSVYNAVSELPSGAANGTMAWIAGSTNRLYISNGVGWYSTTLTTYIRPAQLVRTIDNPNPYGTSDNDRFGTNLKITNTHMVVGVPLEDDDPEPYVGAGDGDFPGTTGEDSGKVYIYELSTGNLIHTLNNPNPNQGVTNDQFGMSVGINSTQVLVATAQEDNSPTYLDVGKAYVYDISTGNLSYTIDNPNAQDTPAGDHFGWRSDMSETHIIIGARLEDDATYSGAGKAYIFNASNGSLLHTLDNPNAYGTSQSDIFGASVAIHGDYAIVGAYQEGDANGSLTGKAYIFDVNTGNLVHTLDNPNAVDDGTNSDKFGYWVDISSTQAIVGAYSEKSSDGYQYSSTVYIFNLSTGALEHTLENPNAYGTSEFDYAWRCAISDTHAIVGAPNEDEAAGDDSGKVYVFDVDDGSLMFTLDNPNAYGTVAGDSFGSKVAVSNDYIVVSASGENDANGTASGKVYIFAIDQIAPTISSVTDASAGTSPFTLALDGTPTVITVTAADGNADTLTYSYAVTSGTLGDTTVSQVDNVFTITPSGSTGTFELTFTVSDGVDNTTSVASFAFPQAFDLIATGADGDSFAGSTQYVFNNDGTEVTGFGSSSSVRTYALDTAYDVFNVSTRNALRNKTIPDHAYAFVYGIAFNGDGTKIFITDAEDGGTSGREINTFTLSTAYDISTMSASATATDNLYTSSGGASGEVEGLHFNTNGTKMFTWDQNSRRLIEWNLSSAYTPSSASLVTALTLRTVIENSGHSGNASSIFSGNFNADGTRLYVADWSGVVYLIRLSTGFDLSTATHTQGEFFDLTSYAEYPQGITLNSDETVLTVRAQGISPATGNLYQFLVPTT